MLNSVDPPESRAYLFERILPFELEVMQTRLKYWAGDHMGYLDALAALLRKCKVNAKQGRTDGSVMSMWKERGARVALIIATQMAEMKVNVYSSRPHVRCLDWGNHSIDNFHRSLPRLLVSSSLYVSKRTV